MSAERPARAWRRAGRFLRSVPRARLASSSGSVVPLTRAWSMARPETPRDIGGHGRELDAGVFEDLVEAIGFPGAVLDQDLAIPGEVAQFAQGRGGTKLPRSSPCSSN